MENTSQMNSSFPVLILSGILGVLLKHGLHSVFIFELEEPFQQFPANMVGCFLLGFFRNLSTGAATAAGSVTSFSGWIQAIVFAALTGQWLFALASLVTGLELAYMSFKVGLDTAEMILPSVSSGKKTSALSSSVASFLSFALWPLVVALAIFDPLRRSLWLACAAAPPGVWIRALLSKMNREDFHWLPVGTFITNSLASVLHAVLSFINNSDPATALAMSTFQKGFIDSMGTTSSMVAEAGELHRHKDKGWRAYLYVLFTMATCLLVTAIICATSTDSPREMPNIIEIARKNKAYLAGAY